MADAERLPIATSQLQSVVSLGAWRHFAHPTRVLDEIVRVLEQDGALTIGYFPPAIAGVFHARPSGFGGRLLKLYDYVTNKLGYTDRADAELETETVEEAAQRFGEVRTVKSGAHSRLVVAQHPNR